jgi:hypothetical protein
MDQDNNKEKNPDLPLNPDADLAATLQQQFLAEFSGAQAANPAAVNENDINMAKSLIEALAQRM